MPDTEVALPALEGISTTLLTASTDLESLAAPPEPPEAGLATGILASMLSHVSTSIDGAITGLGAAGDAVTSSRELFGQTEDVNRAAFSQG
jgi:hypothetical protein